MTLLAIILVVVLAGFYSVQSLMTFGFVRKLNQWTPENLSDADCPSAAVILCLRGKDPFLEECIQSLLQQDYPDYQVYVIVDHESDEARIVAEQCISRLGATNIEVEILHERRKTCSLKCSSLLQAVQRIDDSREIVAMVDADAAPHPTWLRELAAPLLDDRVGATTGNRWYMPANSSLGAVLRYMWNLFAIVQMYCYGIAWGGSLALRMRVIQESGLRERWGQAFCEDTMLYKILSEQKMRLVFVPSAIMVNREDCNIGGCFRWVARQLLTARLYHPAWMAVLLHGFLSAAIPLVIVGALFAATVAENWQAVSLLAGGTLLYVLCLFSLLWPLERSVRRLVANRGEETEWMSPRFWIYFILSGPLLQLLYPAALASTVLMRRVDWRGVEYRIDDAWNIRMLEYRPYDAPKEETRSSL